jgi:hypothetical protein
MRKFFRILPLAGPGSRHKTRIVPLAGPVMRYNGTGLRHISGKTPLAGLKVPLAGPGSRRNFL